LIKIDLLFHGGGALQRAVFLAQGGPYGQ